MRKLLFLDPGGTREWTERFQPGELVLFRVDPRTKFPLDSDGVWAFASLDGAREYAAGQAVNQITSLTKSTKNGDAPVTRSRSTMGARGATRQLRRSTLCRLAIGATLLCAAPFFILYDVRNELRLVWACLIGIKLTLVGIVCCAQGLLALRAPRAVTREKTFLQL